MGDNASLEITSQPSLHTESVFGYVLAASCFSCPTLCFISESAWSLFVKPPEVADGNGEYDVRLQTEASYAYEATYHSTICFNFRAGLTRESPLKSQSYD